MSTAVCYCPKCSDEKFNSSRCMFCQAGLKGEGKLKSSNGARVCISCIKKGMKLLEEDKI
jgi:ribosomal protein L24E